MRNAYVDLCLQVQAIRRSFEGIRTPLAPAVGVAASLYTHQVANVQRVLTDVRVRHLLADEVGLGKTVQALMVLNALRSQRTDLKALVVVPDQLVAQWRDEIMTRAHTAPFGEGDGVEGEQYIRLAWEEQLRIRDPAGNPKFALADIDPDRFDVLVVDELHRLRADVQDRIVRAANRFEHILVLTATPAFQHVKRHAQIFALLEPERAVLARGRIAARDRGVVEGLAAGDDLSKWPEWAAAAVVNEFVEADRTAASAAEHFGLCATALVHCAYRRVIRTRRVDYSGVLPRRRHQPLIAEPLGAEVERQSLMWQYFEHLGDLSREFDPVRLAKRVVLSPPSLEQRVDFLRRKGHERTGLLERVKPLVHRSQGDSRADVLIDLLAEIWANDPTERVLVAAQDNLTVDYLFDLVRARLPVIGPLSQQVPLVAARVRQGMMTDAVEDLGGFGNETNENLDAFQRGEAQVLFAPEAVQVGLNLQCARVLVLYSVPWRPEEVEQWIGRLDRIGNVAAFSNEGQAKAIDVYTIVQRGLVDEKVVNVLQRFHAFERSVNLDGDHLDEVARLIEDAALRPGRINWRELADATEVMAHEDEVQELDSELRKHLPWTVQSAIAGRQWLESLPPAPPVLSEILEHSALGPRAWDRALEGMLRLLSRAGEYHIRWNLDPETGSRFRSLWYQFGERGMYGKKDVQSRVLFSFGADPGHDHSPRHAHAFITRRGDIGTPPRRSVTMVLNNDRVWRPLRFLNFGDALHDELIKGWLPQSNVLVTLDVMFFEDHVIWENGVPGLYLLRLSIIDPADALMARVLEERTLQIIAMAATFSDPERLLTLMRPFKKAARCALEADVRWLRGQFAAYMSLDMRLSEQGSWVQVEAGVAAALLNPMAHKRAGIPRARELRAAEADRVAVDVELADQRQADATAARSAWSQRFPGFKESLAARLTVVDEEGRDAYALAIREVHQAEEALEVARERGNRAQITRAENACDFASDTLRMTRTFWEERVRWLQECEEEIRAVRPQEKLTALVRVREIE
jgi:ATP-dependent helicase HepA